MDSGPGCDPQLHRDVQTYSQHPVLAAQFIPSIGISPPISFHLLLYELKERVYGQIISEREHRQFPENPIAIPDPQKSTYELEYESRDHYDPLVALTQTESGLQSIIEAFGGCTPILSAVEVVDEKYVEAGKDLMQKYGTPLSELDGELADVNILSDVITQPRKENSR